MKRFKKLVAVGLSAAMVLSATAVFANPAATHLQGTGAVLNPTFAVLLPAVPVVTVNPMRLGSTTAAWVPQITSPWYAIANRSNVPIHVEMRVAPHTVAAAANAATFAENQAGLDTLIEETADVRAALLQLQFAGAAPSGDLPASTANAAVVSGLAWTVAAADPHRVALHTPATGAAAAMEGGHVVEFLLDAQALVDGGIVVAPGPMTANQLTAYSFTGAVNPAATWAANQVTARVVFTITGIAPTHYAAIVTDAEPVAGAHRVFEDVDLALVVPEPT